MSAAEEGLDRFLRAQAEVGDAPLRELSAGRKLTHWMWFEFPQIAGLGQSPMARRHAIRDLAEARAFHAHPLLGSRLRRLALATLPHADAGALTLFGSPDHLKFCSCLTLFGVAAPDQALFRTVLDAFFGGEEDRRTLDLLGPAG